MEEFYLTDYDMKFQYNEHLSFYLDIHLSYDFINILKSKFDHYAQPSSGVTDLVVFRYPLNTALHSRHVFVCEIEIRQPDEVAESYSLLVRMPKNDDSNNTIILSLNIAIPRVIILLLSSRSLQKINATNLIKFRI